MSNLYTRNYEIITECDFESGNRLNNTSVRVRKRVSNISKVIHLCHVYCRGQQLAQQMEQTNPELVTQLRTQFGRGGPPNSEGGDPSQQSKMWSMY